MDFTRRSSSRIVMVGVTTKSRELTVSEKVIETTPDILFQSSLRTLRFDRHQTFSLDMHPLRILYLAILSCVLMACTKPAAPETTASPDAIVNLSTEQLGMTNATSIITALRELAKANTEQLSVQFISGERSLTFDIILAQHESDYDIKKIEKTAEGKWVHPRPPAEPPGRIFPTWVRVTTEGIIVGASKFSDAEFSDWLKNYAMAISSVSERSALVWDADGDVSSARFFDILSMQADHRLDRLLIEKEAEKQDDVPLAPSPARIDDADLD